MKPNLLLTIIFSIVLLSAGCGEQAAKPGSPGKVVKDFYGNLKARKFEEAYFLIHPDCRKLMNFQDWNTYCQRKYKKMFGPIVKIVIGKVTMEKNHEFLGKTYSEAAAVATQINLSRNGRITPITMRSILGRDEIGDWRIFTVPFQYKLKQS
ncbi:MAG: hypothetical protein ACM3WV_02865 [Bacillota bacterium]